MAVLANLVVQMSANTSAFEKGLKSAKDHADKMGSSMGTALKVGALAGAAGLGVLAIAAFDFVKAAAADQASVAQLQKAVENTGVSWADYSGKLDASVTAAQKMAFSDDAARQSLSLLMAQTGDADEAMRRFALAQDVARGAGIDLEMSSKLLGKVTEENVNVFKKMGISLEAGASEAEAFAALQKKFGGQAAVYAKSTAGQFAQVGIQIGELKEKIGYALLPVALKLGQVLLTVVVPALSKMADWIVKGIGAAIKTVGPLFTDLGITIGNLVKYFQAVVDDGDVMNDWLGHLPEPIRDIVKAFGEFLVAMQDLIPAVGAQVFKDFQETILPGIQDALAKLKEPLGKVVDFFTDLFKKAGKEGGGAASVENVAKAVEGFLLLLTVAALVAVASFAVHLGAMALNFALMPLKIMWEAGAAIKDFVTQAAKMVSKAITITQKIVKTGADIISGLMDTVQTITQKVTRSGAALITDFKDKVQKITQKVVVEAPSAEEQGKVTGTSFVKGIEATLAKSLGPMMGGAIGYALGAGWIAIAGAGIGTSLLAALGVAAAIVGGAALMACAAIPIAVLGAIVYGLAKVPWSDVANKILYGLGVAVTLVLVSLAEIFILIPLAIQALIARKLKDFGVWIWETILPSLITFGTQSVPNFFTETVPDWAGKVAELTADAFRDFGKWIADTALPGIGKFITDDLPRAFTEGIPNILAAIALKAAEIGQAIIDGIVSGLSDLITDPRGTLISWILDPIAIGVNSIGNLLDVIGGSIAGTIIGGIGDALGAMGEALGKQFIQGMKDMWEYAKAHDPTGLLKHFSPSLAGIEVGHAFGQGIAKGIEETTPTFVDAMGGAAVQLMEAAGGIGGMSKAYFEAGVAAMLSLAGGITEGSPKVILSMDDIAKGVKLMLDRDLGTAGTSGATSLISGLTDETEASESSLGSDVANSLRSAMASFSGEAVQWGKGIAEYIMSGIYTGFVDNFGGWAQDIATIIYDKLKEALGAASPAKKMIPLGAMAAQGYVQGWQGALALPMPSPSFGSLAPAYAPVSAARGSSGGIPGGGSTIINNYHIQGSILSERDLKRIVAEGLRHGEFRGMGA